jgi:hypothetical protein
LSLLLLLLLLLLLHARDVIAPQLKQFKSAVSLHVKQTALAVVARHTRVSVSRQDTDDTDECPR